MDEGPIQDLAIRGCAADGSCSALVLARRGGHLVECRVPPGTEPPTVNATPGSSLPLSRLWLEDRGGVPLDGSFRAHNLLYPEEVSSMGTVPCGSASDAGASKAELGELGCVVVGTTAQRIVQLSAGDAPGAQWAPQALFQSEHGEVPEPGSFALIGDRYLGVLQRKQGSVQVLDLQQSGAPVGAWTLSTPSKGSSTRRWASICAGGGAFYALEDAQDPQLWQFEAPPAFTQAGSRLQ